MRAHPAGPRHGEILAPAGAPPAPTDSEALHALAPSVWPLTAVRLPDDGLAARAVTVAGVDVRTLAEDFGTPLYVLDEDDFRARAAAFRAAYADPAVPTDVFYAGKAFLCSTVARWVEEEGLNLDVCSGGELLTALRAGFPGDRMAFHGNNKSTAELELALDNGVGRYVVDSFEEIVRLAAAAAARGTVADVLVRVTVGVEAHTHEFIATAHEDQKFGFSLANGDALEAVRRIVALPSLRLLGLHSHIGSQIFDTAAFEVSAHRLVGLAASIRDELGIEAAELDLGGGMGIAYTEDDDPISPKEMADLLRDIVTRECSAYGLALPRLAVEPGRAVVGPSMITVYEVGTVKKVDLGSGHARHYVSVDGGMSDNIRTALYDAEYTVRLVSRVSDADPVLSRIVGKHCESGDIVVRDCWLPGDLVPGDLVAVAATGAYCRAMASNYNYVPRPAVVSVKDGRASLVLRRETLDDLLALDAGLAP
ncbi:MAG TPA: diaminopimelate decarboxylase [Candidatus Nanopelagicales bacterium]|nr:diaminopimelate decarboxylase [Candidatus Nanopelagicales bacterium]